MFATRRSQREREFSFSKIGLLALGALAVTLVLGLPRSASAMIVTCGDGSPTVVTPDLLDATLFGVVADCNGARFDGTAQKIDTGTPSDLLVKGIWTRKAGGPLSGTTFFSQDGYTQPNSPTARAWHVLKGNMDLTHGDIPNASAKLSVEGTLDGTPTTGATTSDLGNGALFFIVGPFTNDIPDGPLWTRTATYTWTFNASTGVGDRIVFNATGNNYWEAVPEPTSLSLLGFGLAGLYAARRRQHRLAA